MPPRKNGRATSKTGRARPGGDTLPGRKGGAYTIQRCDTCGIPRVDVRVERPREFEHLRAEATRGPRRRKERARTDRRAYAGAKTATRMRTRGRTGGRVDWAGTPR